MKWTTMRSAEFVRPNKIRRLSTPSSAVEALTPGTLWVKLTSGMWVKFKTRELGEHYEDEEGNVIWSGYMLPVRVVAIGKRSTCEEVMVYL